MNFDTCNVSGRPGEWDRRFNILSKFYHNERYNGENGNEKEKEISFRSRHLGSLVFSTTCFFRQIRFKKMSRIQLIKGDTYLTLDKMVIHEKMMQLFRLIYNNVT